MVALGVVLAVLSGLLAWALSAPFLAVAVAAGLGLVVGLVLGQGLMWLRVTTGRAARIEYQTLHRLEGMRIFN